MSKTRLFESSSVKNMAFKAPPDPPKALPRASRTDPDVHSLRFPPELSHDVFSTFVGQPHAKPHFLRVFLEGIFPKIVSKVCVLYGAVMKKSKTLHQSVARVTSAAKTEGNARSGTHPRILRIPRIRCQEPRLGTTLPRAPGARMT